jgi:hypothetical protein
MSTHCTAKVLQKQLGEAEANYFVDNFNRFVFFNKILHRFEVRKDGDIFSFRRPVKIRQFVWFQRESLGVRKLRNTQPRSLGYILFLDIKSHLSTLMHYSYPKKSSLLGRLDHKC